VDLQSDYGVNSSLMWSYLRWSATDPGAAVTGRIYSGDALQSTTPTYVHRVDTYTSGSVESDWSSWSLRSTWTQAAASMSDPQSALSAPAQQFIVSHGTAELAAMSPEAVAGSVINAVSPLLGMSASDVTTGLDAGQSLSDLAATTGTSHGDLVNAIRSALPDLHDPILQTAAAEQLAENAGPLDTSALQVAPSSGGDETQVLALSLSTTANLLGLTPTDLMARLSQGASLNSVADSRGISHTDLITAVQSDLPPQTPGWTDRAALAEQIAADTTSATEMPTTGQRFTFDLGSGPQTMTLSLDNTANLLGATSDSLMLALSQGFTLNDIADGAGVAHNDLINALSTDLPSWAPNWIDANALAEQLAATSRSATIEAPAVAPTSGQQFTVDPGTGTGPQTLTVSLDATAALLSTTTTDLMAQLSAGTSLNTIADGLSVSHSDLIDALVTDLPTRTSGWTDVNALAEQLAAATDSTTLTPPTVTPAARQQFGVDPGTGPQTVNLTLENTANVLSTTSEYLMARLSGGTSLSTLADGLGVTHSSLVEALVADLPEQTPGWSDATTLAEAVSTITNSTTVEWPPEPATTGGQQFTVDPGTGPQTLTLSLDNTASLLFTTPTALMAQLSQGTSLNTIADSLGITHSSLIDALVADLPEQTPGWSDVTTLAEQLAGVTDSTTA
jgi:uncharacterized protein YidB (DUF937 family)